MSDVEFGSLLGGHMLGGVDIGVSPDEPDEWGGDPSVVRFLLDGQVYEAKEDPEDGYRSCMKYLRVVVGVVVNVFSPVMVVASKAAPGYDDNDILEFTSVDTGKVVLRVGTSGTSDYYPSFVGEFSPENLPQNKETPNVPR